MPSTLRREATAIPRGPNMSPLVGVGVWLIIAQVQIVRSACTTRTNTAICSSQRLHGEIDKKEVREVVLRDDSLRLSSAQDVAMTLNPDP